MTTTKIQSTHCDRIAFVYVRQSTPLQVIENRESTERQYHLRERAIERGWPSSRVEVIDEDQGRSGSTATYRTGQASHGYATGPGPQPGEDRKPAKATRCFRLPDRTNDPRYGGYAKATSDRAGCAQTSQ